MKINCGIIGLPNVGKSTLFKLLTNISVKIDNFPFSTIQPNIAATQVSDDRLYKINNIAKSQLITPNNIEFIDIAGLIKGASKGEGLGNQILNYIKTSKILCHVVRCFDNNQIIHVRQYIDPQRDINIINTELILFDISQCEQYVVSLKKDHNSNTKINQTLFFLKKCLNNLYNGIMLRNIQFSKIELEQIKKFNLLTFKPVIYVANIDKELKNNIYFKTVKKIGLSENVPVISYSLFNKNKLKSSSQKENILLNTINNNIIYLLKLKIFFTVNTKMTKAWFCPHHTIALDAAYKVHSDFKKGFIRAQVIKFDDFITYKGKTGAKKFGKIYSVGKYYLIQDGDILNFLFHKIK